MATSGAMEFYHLALLEAVRDIAETIEYFYGTRRIKHALKL